MIYKHEDFIERLAAIHPEVELSSLELIVKRGLQGINRTMKSNQELILNNFISENKRSDYIKFFIYMTPKEQNKHALNNYYKKQEKKQDGRAKNDIE